MAGKAQARSLPVIGTPGGGGRRRLVLLAFPSSVRVLVANNPRPTSLLCDDGREMLAGRQDGAETRLFDRLLTTAVYRARVLPLVLSKVRGTYTG